jgi:uncharacterized protein YacL
MNITILMIIKSIVIIAFILIIISLGSALFHLIKNKPQEQSEKTVKALTFRITLSIILFIFIFIALATGMFTPHGLGTRVHQAPVAPAK